MNDCFPCGEERQIVSVTQRDRISDFKMCAGSMHASAALPKRK